MLGKTEPAVKTSRRRGTVSDLPELNCVDNFISLDEEMMLLYIRANSQSYINDAAAHVDMPP